MGCAEAFFYGVPCVTMRDETEWQETIDTGANLLAGANADRIVAAVDAQLDRKEPLPAAGPYYGEGAASARIASLVARMIHPETDQPCAEKNANAHLDTQPLCPTA